MASISIIGMTGWVNPYSRLPGALGPSSSHGGGPRAPFFVGSAACGVARRSGLLRQRTGLHGHRCNLLSFVVQVQQ